MVQNNITNDQIVKFRRATAGTGLTTKGKTMLKKAARQNSILLLLKGEGSQSIADLTRRLDVSEMTVRRDIQELADNGFVKHKYGNVMLSESEVVNENNYYLEIERDTNVDAKTRIGKLASTLIEADDVLIMDNGSTIDCLAEYLPRKLPLTVICFNYNILERIVSNNDIHIIFAGGEFHPHDQFFESEEGIRLIRRLRANKFFLSASGINKSLGVTCSNHYEVATKRASLESSAKAILLVDSSKFDQVNSAYFADLKEIDTIVTDDNISPEWKEYCESMGIKVLIA